MAQDDDGREPTPPPGVPLPGSATPTGGFPAGGEPAGPPSGMLTGAFRAPPPDEAPAGPPSVAVTGAFPAPPPPASKAETDVTRIEPSPRAAATAPTLIERAPARRGTGRADRGDLSGELADGGRPTGPPPARDVRPGLEPKPAQGLPVPPRQEPPQPLPPAPRGGGGAMALLVCLVCLGGIGFLVLRAFPELFGRRGATSLQVTRPGSTEWLEGRAVVVGVKVTGFAGAARWSLRGGAIDQTGAIDITPDGQLTLPAGTLPEGAHDVELRLEGRTAAGEPALATAKVRLRIDATPPALEVDAPAASAPGAVQVVARVRDASSVQLACLVDGRMAWTLGVDPAARGEAAVVTRPVQLAAGRHVIRLEAQDGAGHVTAVDRTVEVGATTTPEVPKPETPKPETPKPETPKPETPRPEVPSPAPTLAVAWPAATVVAPGFSVAVRVDGATKLALLVDGVEVRDAAPASGPLVFGRDVCGPDGAHEYELVATSPGGTKRDGKRLVIDGLAPVVDVEVTGEVEAARLTGRVSDAVDPAPRLSVRVDDGPPVAVASLPHALALRPGEHAIELLARDAAGNQSRRALRVVVAAPTAPEAPPVVKVPHDTVAPAIEVLSPAAPFLVREARVEVRVTDASGATARVRIDGAELRAARAAVPGGAVLTAGPLRLPDGPHELVVEAEDPRGNRREATTRFTLDTVPPDLALLAGARSWAGPVDLQARVTDVTSGVAAVEVHLPDGRVVPFQPGQGELLVARFELAPGTHDVTITASDRAGNVASASRPVTVEAPAATVIQLPARSGLAVRVEGSAPAGSTVVVDANGERLATARGLPVTVTVGGPGRYFMVVTVTPPRGQPVTRQGQVEVDASPPTLRRLRVTPLARDRAQVHAEVVDAGPVQVQVLANGTLVATSLPCEVPLVQGKNEVVVVAVDDVGNEARELRTVDVSPPQPEQPPQQPPPGPAVDPRQTEAENLLAANRPADALPLLDALLAETRAPRAPLVLRARAHEALAAQLHDATARRNELNQAISDMNRAIVNYGGDVRGAHFRQRGNLFQALGRRRAAEEDFEEAERLEARGR